MPLSNATEHTRKKYQNPQRDEGNLRALRDQCDPMMECHGTIIKMPCHKITGNIFPLFFYKMKIMDVNLRFDDIWK